MAEQWGVHRKTETHDGGSIPSYPLKYSYSLIGKAPAL